MTQGDKGCGTTAASCILHTPIGPLRIVESGGLIEEVRLACPASGGADYFSSQSSQSAPPASSLLLEARRQLDEYFSGRRKSFHLPIGQDGTAFQQQVWQALCEIPYGQTRSYQDIAAAVGRPGAMRAVGQANNRNRILILVPCHRVIQKDGGLGGFGCGTEAKRWLLELEGRI